MAPWVEGQDWVDGDFLTEQRLDEQQGNADYVREEARHRIGAQSGERMTADAGSGFFAYWGRLRLTIGGNTYQTEWVQNPLVFPAIWLHALPKNEALSGLANGTVYDLDIFMDVDTAVAQGTVTAHQIGRSSVFFVEDMGYLSVFARVRFSGLTAVIVDRFSVIITRDDEAL